MTTHADLAEVSDQRIVAHWALGQWADRLLEQAGLGVTIVDRHGTVMYYNKWASEHLDREAGFWSPSAKGECLMNNIALGFTLWLLADAIDATRERPTLASTALSIHASVQGGALLTRVNRWLA